MVQPENKLSDFQDAIRSIDQEYGPLTPAAIQELAGHLKPVFCEKGEQIVREGQFCDLLFFVQKGALRAFYLKDGRDISDWFAFEGEFVCAINSFFMEVPSPHFIESLEDSMLLAIPRAEIEAFCAKHHCLEKLARLSVTRTMLELQARIVSLQFETAKNRYAALRQRHPHIDLRVPQRHIASFLGITPETLSRIRAEYT